MQKWEYAYIDWSGGELTLTYLHPTGETTLTVEKGRQPGFFKGGDYRGQMRAWIITLGQEGYEMTVATHSIFPPGGQDNLRYWFKRPL